MHPTDATIAKLQAFRYGKKVAILGDTLTLRTFCQRDRERASQVVVSGWPRGSNTGAAVPAIASPVGIRDSYSSASSVPTMIPSQAFPSLFRSFLLLSRPLASALPLETAATSH